jgi:D-alanine-D-alanine ligase-like ATP-grasp enzyme
MAKVLLFTTVRWLSAPRIAGAFAAAGAQVHALYPRRHLLAHSRYVDKDYTYDLLRHRASLQDAIAKAAPDLIVPLDDRAARQLAADADNAAFAPLIRKSLGNPAAYPALMSRIDFLAAARDAGIRTPETLRIETPDALEAALKQLGLPAVLKADNSWGGDGVAVVRSLEEARDAFTRFTEPLSFLRGLARAVNRKDGHFLLDALRASVPSVVLQPFVAGKPATTSFACWQGEVLAAVHLDVAVSEGTGPACVVRPVDCPEMLAAAKTIAARIGLSGLHGLDFIRDTRGHVHLLEINPRATQTSYLALGPGRDLMAPLLARATGHAFPDRPAMTEKDAIALFPQEWSRDPVSPWLQSAYHAVPWDDPDFLKEIVKTADVPAAAAEAFFTSWKPSVRSLP